MFKRIIKKIKILNNTINNFEQSINYQIKKNYLQNLTLINTELITQPGEPDVPDLIVSLTTYSKRVHDVHLVIETIAQQSIKPNRLILWLDEGEFSLDTIPSILHKQIDRGLEIRFCPNYRSYKKLIPTLKLFPTENIITIDDDVLYPHDMIEQLCKEHARYPEYIIGHRANRVKLNLDGSFAPYEQWERGVVDCNESNEILLIGIGGIFYPKGCFNNTILDEDIFMDICPSADDVWFKAMSLINNVKCKKVEDDRDFFSRFLLIQNTQDIALYRTNITANDKQLKDVFKKYDLYQRLLC